MLGIEKIIHKKNHKIQEKNFIFNQKIKFLKTNNTSRKIFFSIFKIFIKLFFVYFTYLLKKIKKIIL